ncbi:MAG: TIGR00730 family Rossman fold protein [Bacteroidales bacterium]|nr:TIGR00730 family Rossman fold protein [Bacteroidales bacterium]MBN2755803.1 TIGR00730 family Rossman fold protein [Bacteroidales bacterium]
MQNICVFCSSSDAIDEKYNESAGKLADIFIEKKLTLINGGAKVGMMGIMSRKINKAKGKVIGIIPEVINNKQLACKNLTELIVTKDMRSRKEKMSDLSDAFIALAGGFGTLEELMEVITLKQLEVHEKPIVILNTDNFYTKLIEQFEVFYENNFTKSDYKNLYFIAGKPEEAIDYILNYDHSKLDSKWYKTNLNV